MAITYMKHLLGTILLLASLAPVSAQPYEHAWTKRFATPENGEKLWRLAVDESGNVYAAGNFSGTFSEQGISVTSAGAADILLLKYDPDGQLLWARSAGGPYDDVAFGAESDKDGNVYITGGCTSFAVFGDTALSVPGQNGALIIFSFVARYSPDGELRWVRNATSNGAANSSTSCVSYSLKLDRLGDLVMAGGYSCAVASSEDPALSTLSYGGVPFRTTLFPGQAHVFAQKLDTLGNTLWLHTVGDVTFSPGDASEGFGTLVAVDVDATNHVWLGGDCGANTHFNSGPVQLETAPFQALVYELSPQGQPLSAFVLPATTISSVEDMAVAPDGDLLLGGSYNGTFNGSAPAQGIDGFVVRTEPSGTINWTKLLQGPQNDFVSGISNAPNDRLVVGCYYFYQAEFDGAPLATSPGNSSALVVLDATGNEPEVVQPQVVTGYSFIADVQTDIFDNIFVCGDVGGQVIFTNDTLTCLTQDTYVSKLSRQEPQSVSRFDTDAGPRLWPNPATDRLNVENPGLERARLELRDASGRLVSEHVLQPGVHTVEVGALADGLYHAVLVSGAVRAGQHLIIAH